MNLFLAAILAICVVAIGVWVIGKIARTKRKLPVWVDKEPPIMLVSQTEPVPEPIPEPVPVWNSARTKAILTDGFGQPKFNRRMRRRIEAKNRLR